MLQFKCNRKTQRHIKWSICLLMMINVCYDNCYGNRTNTLWKHKRYKHTYINPTLRKKYLLKIIIHFNIGCRVFNGQSFLSMESSLDVLPVPVITTLINTQKLRKTCNLLYVFPHFVDFNMPYYHSVFSVIFC